MIVNPNITTYIHSLETEGPPVLEKIRREALRDGVPVIRRETESLIRVILKVKNPENILEIGAGTGYSAIFMALLTGKSCRVTTIENNEERAAKAGENMAATETAEKINLIEKDAAEALANLEGTYDFIFLDAAKAQYALLLPDIIRLLSEGGVLMADNVLQEGETAKSRYAVERRHRTVHARMREFLWEVKHTECLDTAVLTVGDGVTLSVKKHAS